MTGVFLDGTSTTIIAGEQVRQCPTGAMNNPWGLWEANKRFTGGVLVGPKWIAVAVNASTCTQTSGPPPGRAAFATGHTNTLHFLMGDGSVQACDPNVNVNTVLIPALTPGAGDLFPGF